VSRRLVNGAHAALPSNAENFVTFGQQRSTKLFTLGVGASGGGATATDHAEVRGEGCLQVARRSERLARASGHSMQGRAALVQLAAVAGFPPDKEGTAWTGSLAAPSTTHYVISSGKCKRAVERYGC